jgi:hypothetical protein
MAKALGLSAPGRIVLPYELISSIDVAVTLSLRSTLIVSPPAAGA